jgi:hypothetical protein
MSASSTAASNTLTRWRPSILVCTSLAGVAAAYLIYRNGTYLETYLFGDSVARGLAADSGRGLHRRNAIRRRRTRTNESNVEELPRESSNNAPEDRDPRETIARPLGDGETVVDEPWRDDDWSSWGNEPPSQRNGQNIVQLLFRVSEDATRRNAYVHRGCQCNSCGTVPIRGIRYRCSNCADFDLCEACEAQGLHIKAHIFYKVRVPTSSFTIRQMQPVWYPGDPDTYMKSLPKELMARLSKETGFDRPELDAYWEQWTFMANTEWREDPDDLCLAMDRKTFDQCLVPSGGNRPAAPNLIHDRMFAFYDTNNDDLISFPEFLHGLAYRKKKDKLKRVFEGFDIDGDGYVDRKDFLRMFRSYYVLYKQMHRDMLEGLDDQVMNSTDAHQLITSRQPLSSAFGRDGRFPPAPNPRTEGKAPGVDGDLIITDGKGVISDSGNDLGNKEDVIIDAVVREYSRLQQPNSWAPTGGNAYWRAVTNPPETISSFQHDVLEDLVRERRRTLQDTGRPAQYLPNNGESELNEINEYTGGDIIDRDWPPSFVTISDVEVVCGEGRTFAQVPPAGRPAVVENAVRRLRELSVHHHTLAVNDEIHERWKRRQFYTDEEEGAVAPPDWKEEEDIPYLNGKAAETSKETVPPSRPISPRSRSSSKVRFAEDTDDYETRSNLSTSSRSIPERWGGMEIPDAEKDAGKEILYQVTQQACNELLDQLFKKQEDLAVAALSSKKARDKYRHLFTNPNFEQWAVGVDKSLKKSKKKRTNISIETAKDIRQEVIMPEVELPEIRQRPLDDLLAIDPEAGQSTDPVPAIDPSTGSHLTDSVQMPSEIDNTASLDSSGAQIVHSSDLTSTLGPPISDVYDSVPRRSLNGYNSAVENQARLVRESTAALTDSRTHSISAPSGTEGSEAISACESEVTYRDSTLPQYRPNSLPSPSGASTAVPTQDINPDSADIGQPGSSDIPSVAETGGTYSVDNIPNGSHRPPARDAPEKPGFGFVAGVQTSRPGKCDGKSLLAEFDKSHFKIARQRALEEMPEDLRKEFTGVDWKALYELREMEALEKQAEGRGGWGRLSWEEFEQAIKGEDALPLAETSRRAMMDFLGSWIEFCIP